jgi:hypothetical protein
MWWLSALGWLGKTTMADSMIESGAKAYLTIAW